MRLAYLDRPPTPMSPDTAGVQPCVVVLHSEGTTPAEEAARVADRLPGGGRVVLPFGDYAFYPSGMEVGGACWYRVLPGYEGTDPISLVKAVVQVGDLVDELDVERLVLIGSGQGGVVALGVGLLEAERRPAVVCIDTPPAHVALLPTSLLDAGRPRVLLLAGSRDAGSGHEALASLLGAHGLEPNIWVHTAVGTPEERDEAMTGQVTRWLHDD